MTVRGIEIAGPDPLDGSNGRTVSIELDGWDGISSVAYEYISREDDETLRARSGGSGGDCRTALRAEWLADRLRRRDVPATGIFYDPVGNGGWIERQEAVCRERVANLDGIIFSYRSKSEAEKRSSSEYLQAVELRRRILEANEKRVLELEAVLTQQSKDRVREQAHDFGEWLVEQGILPRPVRTAETDAYRGIYP